MTTIQTIQHSCQYYATKAMENVRNYANVAKAKVYCFNQDHPRVAQAEIALFNTVKAIKNYIAKNKLEVGCMAACVVTAFAAPKLLLAVALLSIVAESKQRELQQIAANILGKFKR